MYVCILHQDGDIVVHRQMKAKPDALLQIMTERASCAWSRRYVTYHTMTRREDLRDGERKIEAFLTSLAAETFPEGRRATR